MLLDLLVASILNEMSELSAKLDDFARQAYNAYGQDANWKTYDGKPMPKWDGLTKEVQDHWKAAIDTTVSNVCELLNGK